MKKNLKKNVITSSIVTALAAATISPVAIALSQPSENNLVSPTSADGMSTISVGNFGINNNATVFAGVSESDKSTVYAQNPNVTKSVPNGLVTVTNSGKRITVFSQDNPNEILWYSDIENANYIFTIEYTPANDTLVAMYVTTGGDLVVARYASISKNKPGLSTTPSSITNVINWKTSTSDSWVMTPMFRDRGTTNIFLIFKRNCPASEITNSRVYYYDSDAGSISSIRIQWSPTTNKEIYILGVSAWWGDDNQKCFSILMAERNSTSSGEARVFAKSFYQDWRSYSREINFGFTPNVFSQDLSKLNMVLPNTAGVSRYGYIRSTFLLNSGLTDNQKDAYLVTIEANRSSSNTTPSVIGVNRITSKVRHGYFDHTTTMANGIPNKDVASTTGNTKDTYVQQPLIFMSSSSDVPTGDGLGKFVGLITNLGVYDGVTFSVNSTSTSNSNFKIYPMAKDASSNPDYANSSTRWIYKGWDTSINPDANNGMGLNQEAFGIPVLEYNTNNDDLFKARYRNMYVFKSGSAELQMINQDNSNDPYQDFAGRNVSYNYYTKPSASTTLEIGDYNVSPNDVSVEWLNNRFNIEASNWYDSSLLFSNLKLQNVVTTARFAVNPNSIQRNNTAGSVTFNLYGTKLFKSNGSVQWTDDFNRMKSLWWDNHILTSVTITGFQITTKTTSITNGGIGLGSIYASTWETNLRQIKQAIIDTNKVKNPISSLSVDDLVFSNVSFDDALGTLTVTITIQNNKVQISGEAVQSFTFQPATFSGFKINSILTTTTFDGGQISNFAQITPADVDQTSSDFLNQVISLIKYPVSGQVISSGDIFVSATEFNNIEGSMNVNLTVNNSKAWINGQVKPSWTFTNKKLTGFATQNPTAVAVEMAPCGDINTKPSFYYSGTEADDEKLKKLMFDSRSLIFSNLPDDFSADNINIQSVQIDNPNGVLVVNFKLDNFFNNLGVLTHALSGEMSVKITGFRIDSTTTAILGGPINVRPFFPSQWDESEENINEIKQAIIDGGRFQNIYNPNISINDFQLTNVSFNNSTGSLTTTIVLSNYMAQQNGMPIESISLGPVTFTGFKVDTTSNTTIFSGGAVVDFETVLASDMDLTNADFINQIIALVKNPVTETTIEASDISIARISFDNLLGNITINLTINNSKVWINGEIKTSYTFENQVISGFKQQQPTALKATSAQIGDSQIKPSYYYAGSENDEKLRNLIFANRDEIFENIPTNLNVDNIKIRSVTYDNPNGSLTVAFVLNNYYNSQGVLMSSDSSIFTLKVTGFKVDFSTTWISGGELVGVDSIYASTWNDLANQNVIKQAIINSGLIKDLFTENISISDLQFANVSYNDALGEFTTSVVVSNYKGQHNGLSVSTKTLDSVTFSGFKIDKNLITTKFTGGAISGFSDVFATDAQANDQNLLTQIASLISSPVTGQTISASDLVVEIIQPNNISGTMSINLTVNNSKVWINGEIKTSYTFENQVISGFKIDASLNNTIFNGGTVSSFTNIAPSNVQATDINLIQQVISLIQYPAQGQTVTPSDISIKIKSYDNLTGSMIIDLTINNSKVWINGNLQESWTFTDRKLQGFKVQLPTRLVQAQLQTYDINQKPSDYYVDAQDNEKIAQLIFNNKDKLFNNLPSEFTISDINISDVNVSNPTGSINVVFSIKNYYNLSGILTPAQSESFVLLITNFTSDNSTTTALGGPLIKNAEFMASQWEERLNTLKENIIANNYITNLFNPNISIDDIELSNVTFDDARGWLTTNIVILNNKAQQNGYARQSLQLNSVTFTGFKIDKSLTTTVFNGGQISGFANTLASSIKPNNVSLIRQVIELVKNVPSGQTINTTDVQITIKSFNNLNGSMNIDLKINNSKVWIDGQIQDTYPFVNQTITGFKQQLPTRIVNAPVTNLGDSSQKPSAFYSSSSDNEKLQNVIYQARDGIFSDLPEGFTPSNIKIKNVSCDNPNGTMIVIFVLDNFYNQYGVQVSNEESTPFTITITGFKIDNSTTSIVGARLVGMGFLASEWYLNETLIIDAIINQKLLSNTYSQVIEVLDLELSNVSFNDALGSITTNVVIKNNKAQQNGYPRDSFTVGPVTLTGFVINKTLATTTFDGGEIQGFDIVTPSNVQVSDVQFLYQIVKLIKSPANGSTINTSDISVEILTRDNITGSMTINLTIYNSKYWYEGQVETTYTFTNKTITGFATQKPTKIINNNISVPSTSQYPKAFYKNESDKPKIQELMFENRDIIFENLPFNFSSANIIIKNAVPDNSQGTITVDYALNNYYNAQGELVTNPNIESYSLTIIGFNVDSLTTVFVGGRINDFDKVLPSQVDPNNADFLTQIINMVKSPANGQLFLLSDVSVKILTFNNLNGSMVINLTIDNSKVWVDGKVQKTYTFVNRTITGFASQKATSVIANNISIAGYDQVVPSIFWKSNDDNAKISQLIFDYRNQLFENLSASFIPSNIVIKNVIVNDISGFIIVTYNLINFYNEQGVLTNNESKSHMLTISGFATTTVTSTTLFTGGLIEGFEDRLASDIKQNQLPQEFILQVINLISYSYNGQPIGLNDVDITIVTANNLTGVLTINLTIKNFKAQQNGSALQAAVYPNQTIVGFKIQQPTTLISETAYIGAFDSTANEFWSSEKDNDKLRELVFANITSLFANLPVGFNSSNISFDSKPIIDNVEGTMKIDILLNSYIDGQGNLVNLSSTRDGQPLAFSISLTGFLLGESDTSSSSMNLSKTIAIVLLFLGGAIIIGLVIWLIIRERKKSV